MGNIDLSKSLVIIESPGKIKKIQQILGSDYVIKASYGHCIDLPEDKFAVDIKNNFEPEFAVIKGKESVLEEIISLAKKTNTTYIFTDEDREGCAIGHNIASKLPSNVKVKRLKTSSITKESILHAINNPSEISDDLSLVEAQVARRILDRLVGYRTSYITQMATGGRSAGRVQSAILRIIADREEEILNFKPEEYWIITADLLTEKNESFVARLIDKIHVPDEKTAIQIYDTVIKGNPVVNFSEYKPVKSSPYPPFTTLPMIASASTVFGWGAEKTMDVAQDLYEAGICSYMRTDSPFMASDAVDMCRNLISDKYGNKYLPDSPKHYAAKKGAQEAHECCRPTDFFADHHLTGDQAKLYEMIWKRAVASQMTEGIDERAKIVTNIGGYDFVTNGSVVTFDGYRKVWTYSSSKDVVVPKLKEGDKCKLEKLDKQQKFTTPPNRYSDASLAKKCEDEQISRPATFKNFIKTLKDRGYITQKSKSFEATELGIKVTKFLKDSEMCFIDIKFTANLETLLDEIQAKTKNKQEVLTEFWTRLQKDIAKAKEIFSHSQETNFTCPKCQGKLKLKHSAFGAFFACSNYKKPSKSKKSSKIKKSKTKEDDNIINCDYIANVDKDGNPVEKIKKTIEYMNFECKNCGSKMVKRSGKFGDFAGCSSFPKCKTISDLNGVFKETKKFKFKKKTSKE